MSADQTRQKAADLVRRFDESLGRPPFTIDSTSKAKPYLSDLTNLLSTAELLPPLCGELDRQLPILFTAYLRAAQPIDVELVRMLSTCCVECAKVGPLKYSMTEAAKVVTDFLPTHAVTLELLKVAFGGYEGEPIKLLWAAALRNPTIADDVLKVICSHDVSPEAASVVIQSLRADGFRLMIHSSETAFLVLTRWSTVLFDQGLRPVDLLHVIDRRTFGDWVVLCDRVPHTMLVALRHNVDSLDAFFSGDMTVGRECVQECLAQRERLHVGRIVAATAVMCRHQACVDANTASDFLDVLDDAVRTRRLAVADIFTLASRGMKVYVACSAHVVIEKKHALVDLCELMLSGSTTHEDAAKKNSERNHRGGRKEATTMATVSTTDRQRALGMLRQWVDVVDDGGATGEVARRAIAALRVVPRALVSDVDTWLCWGLRSTDGLARERWIVAAFHILSTSKCLSNSNWGEVMEAIVTGELSLSQWASLSRAVSSERRYQAALARAAVVLASREGVERVASVLAPTIGKFSRCLVDDARWEELITCAFGLQTVTLQVSSGASELDAERRRTEREARVEAVQRQRMEMARIAADKEAVLQKELALAREHIAAALAVESSVRGKPVAPPVRRGRQRQVAVQEHASTVKYLERERALESFATYLSSLGVPSSHSLPQLRSLGSQLLTMSTEALLEYMVTGETAVPSDVLPALGSEVQAPSSFWEMVERAPSAVTSSSSLHRRMSEVLDAFDFSLTPPPPLPRWVVDEVVGAKASLLLREMKARRLVHVDGELVTLTPLAVAFHLPFADALRVAVYIDIEDVDE